MSDFQILSEKIHCLKRPAMYIGSISEENISGIINFKYQTKSVIPGLVKIIEEIYQNAVDESIRTNFKYGTNITIDIKNDGLFGWYCEISDNGRGIPLNQVDGIYQAELCWTRARAGSNFGKDEDRITIGTNGLGSFLTNVYSTKFVGISGNGEEQVVVTCSNNCDNVHSVLEKSKKCGTTVKFYPDLSFFNTNEISEDIINIIKDRLYNLAICYPELKIKFNGELLVIKDSKHLSKLVSDNAISLDSKNYNIVITNSGDDEEFRHLSYFNGIAIKNGGSHIDYIISGICEELIPLIKRKWKITVLPNQIKQHLLICFWVRSFPNPRFDSQSKERITNTNGEIKQFFDIDFSKLVKKIMLEDSIIMPMIESILRKKEAQDKRAATLALKKTQKKKIVNHIEATDKNPENKILHIAEGNSAAGEGLNVRDPKLHGFYALRGKVLNTHGMNEIDIVKNKELSELLTILGLDLNDSSIIDNPEELYEIKIDNSVYYAGINDIIIHDNIEYDVCELIKS